jgi:glycosyltransferase involved in cell wall biosynthesis
MKFLYIGSGDVFSRHELGFMAALSAIGEVELVHLGTDVRTTQLKIGSDNGEWLVSYKQVPCSNISYLHVCYNLLKELIKVDEYDIAFSTPRIPLIIARLLFHGEVPIVLRLWSIRAAKLRDNLRFGAYEDIPLFMPSIIANMYYILKSTYSITTDHATYVFAKKFYPFVKNRVAKVYPPYGYIPGMDKAGWEVPEIIDKGNYILGFTVLGKTGSYLKFEAKPHAIVLYLLAKKTGMDVVLAGSSYDDWRRIFPNIDSPRNLHIIDKGFPDSIVAKIYRNARLVIVPITNRSISNRLIEALFYGKPIVTSEVAKLIHPELEHKKHLFISSWNTIVDDTIKLLKNEDLLKSLEQGAKEAYTMFFSTKRNLEILRSIITLK